MMKNIFYCFFLASLFLQSCSGNSDSAKSNNADLANLMVNQGTLSPVFNPAVTNYSVEVPYTVNSIVVTPTSAGINSVIKVNNETVLSGLSSNSIGLSIGNNTVTILVSAEDGATDKIYTVTASVLPGYQATIIKSAEFDNSTDIRFVGEDTSHPKIVALQPLINEIFATYGNPVTNLEKARALRDFVARNAVHPFAGFHLNTVSNSSVLPEGSDWDEFLSILATSHRVDDDSSFWYGLYPNGFTMLNHLLGTVNLSTSSRNDDGMMIKVAPGRYRIRNYDAYRAVLCSWQQYFFIDLLAAAGLHGMQLRTDGHDPGAVFIPELEKWIWEDPTFNEEFTLDGIGVLLSPVEILLFSVQGDSNRLSPVKSRGPDWDISPYIDLSFIRVQGSLSAMGANINNRIIDNSSWKAVDVQFETYKFSTGPFSNYPTATLEQIFPQLGVKVVETRQVASGYQVTLETSFPNHYKYFRRINNSEWIECSNIDVIPFTPGIYSYRSVDLQNNHGMDAMINLVKK